MEQPSESGPPQRALAPGRARFEVGGRAVALEPTLEGDGSLLFVFKDATAPRETYGGGRFLAARAPEGGENVLPLRIEAGEKTPADH